MQQIICESGTTPEKFQKLVNEELAKGWTINPGSLRIDAGYNLSAYAVILDPPPMQVLEDPDVIAIKWHIDDVQHQAKEMGYTLTDDMAREILSIAKRRHDANIGINWGVLDAHIEGYVSDHDIAKS